ncbi:capping protein, Arp2/3 and myosin-I linker protein 2-like [Phycodurus eques]|uniref:capping protein, Arp2/3 and myosin-I linker protein 2-like n=1 Tax=Phycodurus eques TaxID=693459 RepID=UPI002ACE163C|nr:capping protein, Arp2/3 and myosin-I linker protein 2-like [Phycodurus eques]
MELPLGGPALRHYTQSRPRPHRQKLNYRPSRPQETIIESENEVLELIGRVDEGVEEFFTKRVLPADTEQKQDEEPESSTVDEVVPATSVPCPPPTKTLRRKLGDFFTLRKRRGLKSETGHEGRPKKASIADLIRPLREAARADKEKDKDRVKEHDKENEKEKEKEQPSGVTGESTAQETPASDAPPLRGEVAPPRRALREGKSQSLILLSGSAAGTANARKKQFEGQHSFEQKLHLMLQRIGVSKAQPEETQNPESEMKKAESEGTIIDSKVEPTPTFTKHRTMSASSDTRRQIRPSVSAHESAGKPALPPKPVLKAGPGPATSGRNTPENELVQIEEGETSTPTKEKSPTAAPSGPATPAVMSNATADLADVTIFSSSTATSESDVLTVNTTATPANGTDLDGKPSDTEAQPISTEPLTSSSLTALTEPPAPIPNSSSESIAPSPSATSDSTTVTSITALETVSCHLSENETNISVKMTSPVSNGIVSVNEVAISVISTVDASTPASTQSADTKSQSVTSSFTVASDDFTAGSSIGTKSTSVALSSTSPKFDTSITTSSTPPPASTTSITTMTSTDCMDSSPSIVPSTSSSETNLAYSIISTTTNNAALTTADAISSPLMTDPLCSKTSSTFTSVITCLPVSEDSSVTRHSLISPALAHDSPRQDLQRNLDKRSSPTVKDADVELGVVQKSKQADETEKKKVVDDGKESEHCKEKAAQDNNEATKKEAQEGNVKAEDIPVATEEGEAEHALKNERPNQEETKK